MKKIMKIFTRYIMPLITVFAAVVFLLPYTVSMDWVKNRIDAAVESSISGEFNIGDMEWSWFPIPGLAVEGLGISHQVFDVKVSQGVIQLNPLTLISDTKDISIVLQRPDIKIKTLKKKTQRPDKEKGHENQKSPSRSSLDVRIKGGTLRLPSDGFLAPLAGHGHPLGIDDLDAAVSFKSGALTVESTCRLPFADTIKTAIMTDIRPQSSSGKSLRYWDMDIRGQGLNLTEASEKVLLLFGANSVAKTVCGIVRGGRAKTGGFRFQGYTKDFKNIKAMHIDAEADRAIIRVPGVDLHLVDASGPIAIENGILTGSKLNATLGHSHGKNGDITLALTGKQRAFHLALDLFADIAELPALLRENLIKNKPRVTAELNRISRAEGCADARLVIGDTLEALNISVTVISSDSVIIYDRLRHPVRIGQGTILFSPEGCSWSGIRAGIGPHEIETTDGRVSWKEGVLLDLAKMDASIDSGEFLSEIMTYASVRDKLSPKIRGMDGRVHLNGLTVSGKIQKQLDLVYKMSLKTDGITFESPVVSGGVALKEASIKVDNAGFMLEKGMVEISDEDGKIHGLTALSKVLTFINVTELLSLDTWRYMLSEGFHYSNLKVAATVTNNLISLNEAYIKGQGLDMYALGDVDLNSKSLDLCAFVQPLKIFGSLADAIHLKHSEKDSITLIPLKVSGPFRDPNVEINKDCRQDSKNTSVLGGMVKKILSLPGRMMRAIPGNGDE